MRQNHAQTLTSVATTKRLVERLSAELNEAEVSLRSLELQAAFENGLFEALGLME